MQLDGLQSERFSAALRNAFTLQGLGRMLLYKLNLRLEDYAAAGDAQQMVFELIAYFNRDDRIEALIIAAREAAPNNSQLFAFAQGFGLGSTGSSRQQLERIIEESNSMLDPDLFRAKLGLQEMRVCRVEVTAPVGTIFGTGFLVSPDTLLTNHHVIESMLPAGHSPHDRAPKVNACARFDFKRLHNAQGQVVGRNEGRTCAFAEDWLVDFSPVSRNGSAHEDELDYALIRLSEPAGSDLMDGNANTDKPLRRGFVDIPTAAVHMAQGSSLFILQHPRGEPLRLALETKSVLGLFDNKTRVRYTTNTMQGSSGSPCFTHTWELAAIHHSGDPDFDPAHKPAYNEGTTISAVMEMIRLHGHAADVGARAD